MTRMIAKAQPAADVVVTEWVWKSEAMRAMTLAVCRVALVRGVHGTFSALDLPDRGAECQGGTGIAGSVFRTLADREVIAPAGAVVDGEFIQRRVRNACGNPIGLWRLASGPRARSILAAFGEPERVAVQEELRL